MTTSAPTLRAFRIPTNYVIALVPAAVALNIVGSYINTALKLPTFLDMIGTAVVAIADSREEPRWNAAAKQAGRYLEAWKKLHAAK